MEVQWINSEGGRDTTTPLEGCGVTQLREKFSVILIPA
jgi:hypothetical protein